MFQLILVPLGIIWYSWLIYGELSKRLDDFGKGFLLGAIIFLLPLLVQNLYLALKPERGKEPQKTQPEPKATQVTPRVKVTDELLALLRSFLTRWQQFEALGEARWSREHRYDMQSFVKSLSGRLLAIDSRYADSFESSIRNQVQIISNELRQFGVAEIRVVGPRDYDAMNAHGKRAYDLTRALVSSLESTTKRQTDFA